MSFLDRFPAPRPLLGMVHLLPLPGAPGYGGSFAVVTDRALADARLLVSGGMDGLLVENFGDVPFLADEVGPETVAAMAVIVARIGEAFPVPIGVNVLRNDARAALAIALASGASFLRVNVHVGAVATDQGVITGRAAETLRERSRLRADVAILADVLVKHGAPLGVTDPAAIARDAVHRGLADVLLVTGPATGSPPDPDRLRAVREAVPGTPVLVASGLSPENAADFREADGAIVGSAVKRDGRATSPVDGDRVRRLVEAFRGG